MDRDAAKAIYVACEKSLASLAEAESAIFMIANVDECKRLLGALSSAIAELQTGVRAPVVLQYPDLVPPESMGPPDTDLSVEDWELVAALTEFDQATIDSALLGQCSTSWQKVARVVGAAMTSLDPRFPEMPVGFYALRIARLVESGRLQSQGKLDYMRFSEVRIEEAARHAV